MRIVIDLQACQNADSGKTDYLLALVNHMIRSRAGRDIVIAFSNQFPSRIEMLRAALAPLLPIERLLVCDTPAPDGTLRMQQTIELIRNNFFASLGADLVFAPGLFDHAADTVGTISNRPRHFAMAISVSSPAVLDEPHGATPARAASHERQQASLQGADLLLAGSPQVAALLNEAFGSTRIISFQAAPEIAAQEIWTALDRLLAGRSVPLLPTGRPRLAYVSPLPPERSGIADYSAEVIAQLEQYYDIHLIVPDGHAGTTGIAARFPMHDIAWFDANARSFSRLIYHFGNSNVHWHMFAMLQRHPGIVVLHDFFLSNVIDNLDRFGGVPNAFREALFYSHGYTAMAEHRLIGHNDTIWKYPANKLVLDNATGVIVHSEFSIELAEKFYGPGSAAHWRTLPLLRGEPTSTDTSIDGREAARAALGLGADEFLICSFGMLGSTKLNAELLEAFSALQPHPGRRYRLAYVGGEDRTEYGAAHEARILASGRGDAIIITGFVSAEQYRTYLQAADIAVQLRGMTRGETSASVLDCLLYGIATIVNANGSNAVLPPQLVYMLPDRFDQQQLNDALACLCLDDAERARLAASGKDHVREHHAPEVVGRQYAEAIEAFALRSPHAHYRELIRSMREIGAPSNPLHYELVAAAKAIAANQPPVLPRQLFVDISAVVQSDLKTGIQRVVRSILLSLIKNPPPGYRIEPVYGDGGNRRYRYARRFTLDMLGVTGIDTEDAPIEHRPGDVFLGLDLVANITAQNRQLLEDMRHHGIRIFFVVYDILPLLMPNAFPHGTEMYFREYVEVVGRVADGLVCISRAVADELTDWLGTHAAPRASALEIGYFHLGADISSSAPSTGLPENAQEVIDAIARRPTLLMVGTVEPRKGHEQALAAFDLLWSQNIDVNLVIVGKPGWMVDSLLQRLQTHPQLHRRLFWLNGASDEMLTRLYESCSALLAASVGEGFGLPLIEAAQHRLPIVARNLPVFREVSGDHASYFEGMEASDLANALQEWLGLFAAGTAPLSTDMPWLTWSDSAAELLDTVIGTRCYRQLSGTLS